MIQSLEPFVFPRRDQVKLLFSYQPFDCADESADGFVRVKQSNEAPLDFTIFYQKISFDTINYQIRLPLRIRVHSIRLVTGKRSTSAYRIRATVSRSLGSQKSALHRLQVLGTVGLLWNDEYINSSRWFVRAGLCLRPGQLGEISPGTDLKPLERKGFVTAIDDPAPSGKITGKDISP
jgi:hypothetical protein